MFATCSIISRKLNWGKCRLCASRCFFYGKYKLVLDKIFLEVSFTCSVSVSVSLHCCVEAYGRSDLAIEISRT